MNSRHPLQRFLERHDLSQSELARAMHISRETVNRWIRGRNHPVGQNLLRALEFARRFEARLEAHELFPPGAPDQEPGGHRLDLQAWGEACVLCKVPWNEGSEHLPLAFLHPEIGSDPVGGLCPSCARRTGTDPTKKSTAAESGARSS